MDATLTVIVFIVALIFSVGFLLVVLSLVPTLNQLKSMFADIEKTSGEARELIVKLQEIGTKVDRDMEKLDTVLNASKKTVENISESLSYVNKNILKQSASLVALIPAIKIGWSLIKKIKEKGGHTHV